MTIGEAEQVVVDENGAGHGCERTAKRTPEGRIRLAIGNPNGDCPTGVQQSPRGHGGRARVGELLEGIPDRDRVESPARDIVKLADGDAKSHPTRERGRVRVDVQTFERPASVTSGGEERPYIAPDLEPRSTSSVSLLETPSLRAVRLPLVLVEGPEGRVVRHLARIRLDELLGALAWVAIDEGALPALRQAQRWTLREGDAVRQRARRRPGPQAALVELPQLLHLCARIVGAGDLLSVARRTDGAGGEVV